MEMRVINSDQFAASERAKSSKFDKCKRGIRYFLAKGKDFRPNADTTEDSDIPKENSMRSALATYAKSRGIKVSVKSGKDSKTNEEGMAFAFWGGTVTNPFKAITPPTESNSDDSETSDA